MTPKKRKTRKEKRDMRAEILCREVRFQMAQYGGIADNNRLHKLLVKWMAVTGEIAYVRP
jgi:hypothetical protein